jgi:alpha-tubulin suppressor-like RCC1 family protein
MQAHRVDGVGDVVDVAVAEHAACAVTRRGAIMCWSEQLHLRRVAGEPGPFIPRPKALPGLSGATAIAAGDRNMCAVAGRGKVYCWGVSLVEEWQLDGADNEKKIDRHPRRITGVSNAVEISLSDSLACARTRRGQVLCWGFQGIFVPGRKHRPFIYPPVPVPGITNAVSLSERCARLANGTSRCWYGL